VPAAPVLVAGLSGIAWLTEEGEIESLAPAAALRRARETPPMVCHAKALARRLGSHPFPTFDLLELFAFVRPAEFCLPTPSGLARALGIPEPGGIDDAALLLLDAARLLLGELGAAQADADPDARGIAEAMGSGHWPWAPAVLAAIERRPGRRPEGLAGMAAWRRLKEWQESAPEPPPGNLPVEPAEARRRLAALLREGAEARPQQADYADAVTAAFAPRDQQDRPNVVLAEAGTGVGKTLGYIAPASVWAEKNDGAVWVSTYTRNLQTQLSGELDRLYPDPAEKARRAVIRKGRENYVCLLNYEEALGGLATRPGEAVALGLAARWIGRTRDGELVGGDLPGWLVDLVGRGRALGLADRRGECVHSGCPHYRRCFIEKSVRKARRARIVVANHALVMIQAALGGLDDASLPTRLVFDEGHHVFEAADSAFSLHLSGLETADLRRWIAGAEGGRRVRARGLRRRIEELVDGDDQAVRALEDAVAAARVLPAEGWQQRLSEARPIGPTETFLARLRQQVLARAPDAEAGYSLETEARPPVDGLLDAAASLETALGRLAAPLRTLAAVLAARLEDEAEEVESSQRLRIEAVVRSLGRRGEIQVGGWRRMLKDLAHGADPAFVDWFSVERMEGLESDIGMHRHHLDPTVPFIETVAKPAHGVLVTSATLTDGTGDVLADWTAAEARTGARHLAAPALRARVPSPFDYAAQTRVFIVTDVRRDDFRQVAGAYRALIEAAGGGTLGLFTAIQRLRAVHERIAAPLEAAGLPLLAQHVDAMDVGTLIDIFRAEENVSLLGTDAVRDGVDVPGRSLRLIVFDRVPWPRPDILHKARKAAFGGRAWDDMLTRLKLKQAFGRLVRRADDTGVFVLLDPAMPSRLLGAFPDGVPLERTGLADAVAKTRDFLSRAPLPLAGEGGARREAMGG
jgi:ATP-dependent DNA helicase DinG